MPEELRLTITIEQTCLLLKWLTTCLNKPIAFGNSRLIQNIKEVEWLRTENHGLRRSSSCLQRGPFAIFFKSSNFPCVPSLLDSYSPVLNRLGVVTDIKEGCGSVISYMLEMSSDRTGKYSCSLDQATRLYTYIHKFYNGQTSQKPMIFVPPSSQYTSTLWKDSESCVLHDTDNLFGDMLTILEDLYPKNLLPFFSQVLHVSEQAAVKKYCQLWLKWRVDVHEITVGECTRVWKILSGKWKECKSSIKSEFVAKAWVPSKSELTGSFQLLSPTDCFIPDDLHLLSLFEGRPDLHFVWYPDNTEKMESGINQVYADMQVKNLSLCVQQEFVMGENSGVENSIPNQRGAAGEAILCRGLFMAILGFLARKKYGLRSLERQRLLTPLINVVEITTARPLTSRWTISSLSPPVVVTEDNVMALWSKKDGKFYCLGKDNPFLRNTLARRQFRTQVAEAISHGLLSEHPLVAEELTEFINSLIRSGFELSHVQYELRRKNAKLFEEDEMFLSQLQAFRG